MLRTVNHFLTPLQVAGISSLVSSYRERSFEKPQNRGMLGLCGWRDKPCRLKLAGYLATMQAVLSLGAIGEAVTALVIPPQLKEFEMVGVHWILWPLSGRDCKDRFKRKTKDFFDVN